MGPAENAEQTLAPFVDDGAIRNLQCFSESSGRLPDTGLRARLRHLPQPGDDGIPLLDGRPVRLRGVHVAQTALRSPEEVGPAHVGTSPDDREEPLVRRRIAFRYRYEATDQSPLDGVQRPVD